MKTIATHTDETCFTYEKNIDKNVSWLLHVEQYSYSDYKS